MTSQYVSKVQYNGLKDLVFVTSVGQIGQAKEEVFEVDHLEFLPPYAKTGISLYDFSDNGNTLITCLNSKKQLYLKNDPKLWNKDLKSEFMSKVTRMWDETLYKEGVGKHEVLSQKH